MEEQIHCIISGNSIQCISFATRSGRLIRAEFGVPQADSRVITKNMFDNILYCSLVATLSNSQWEIMDSYIATTFNIAHCSCNQDTRKP